MIIVKLIGIILTLTLLSLSAIHYYWALGGEAGKAAAIPTLEGRPVFTPGRLVTSFIGLTLFLCALVSAVTSGIIGIDVSQKFYKLLSIVISFVFILRAIGDFSYVGFFKQIRNSRFAELDSKYFSPLCVVIGILFLLLGLLT